MYEKDFDNWASLKKRLHDRPGTAYAHPREVWWCSIGTNVGAEMDGKNENFERPVLVLRVYNKETLLVLPMTTKEKHDPFHHRVHFDSRDVWISLTQVRLVSNRRLIRKVDTLSVDQLEEVRNALIRCL